MSSLVFYHFPPSPPSRAALLLIRELNLEVQITEIDLFNKKQLNPDFIKINPQHCIPTLYDNGFILWESRAISQYLVDSRSPNSKLLPKDPKGRAVTMQRLYFDLGTLFSRIRNIIFPVLFLGETKISEEKRQQLAEAFTWLDGFLETSTWVAGDHHTIADFSILASLSSIIYVGADISEYKNISRWYEQCKSFAGYEENDKAAKSYGELVASKLIEKF